MAYETDMRVTPRNKLPSGDNDELKIKNIRCVICLRC